MKKVLQVFSSLCFTITLLLGCSSNQQKSIQLISIDDTSKTKINLMYPYYSGYSVENITTGKLVIEYFNQEDGINKIQEYDLSKVDLDEIFIGHTLFTIDDPSHNKLYLKLTSMINQEVKNEDYLLEYQYTKESISTNHFEYSQTIDSSFKLLGGYYAFDSSESIVDTFEADNIEELHQQIEKCVYCYCIYYEGDAS